MQTLYTIGYEGASLDDFLATLKIAKIRRVLDIRELAQSRRRGFSKNALAAALAHDAIAYSHLRQLGDPKAGREAARRGDYAEFQRIFSAHLELPDTKAALQEAVALCQAEPTVLLCFERDPKHCHRSLVASQINQLCSLSVRHLGVGFSAGTNRELVAQAA